jgi:NAD(P)-dependent dehydrogenase (short-subunit alcohol dehydrogenase family)
MHRRYGVDIPLGRIGQPEEIASAVALLARSDLGALVGQTLQINGGSTRCRV